ncbi:hypothetical protein EG68_00198 [Paragonimus skrjabini miyazakii]|uniref:Uncharacterized protein n=1 Tax=Paragonimus skrjabini miyazakii TaxID=59628 RepID=A0A8S9Z6G2_9TREM|nr:hypothetical protein EG68_00198 [Paragonimus skrjabini miyazakii]
MFLKTNLFKQFRKDVDSFDSSEFHNGNGPLNKSRESILWGGIDDNENNSGCDLDEEDDYFHGNSFMEGTSGGSEDSYEESKWSNFPSYLGVSKKFGSHQSGSRNRLLNIRKNNMHLSDKEVHSTATKEHAPENPKSPSPSKCNDNETAASPMLNFLKRKSLVNQIQSPDNRINSSTDNDFSLYTQRDVLESDMSEVGNSPVIGEQIDTPVNGTTTAIVSQAADNYPEINKLKLLYKNLRQETSKFIKWKTYAGLQLEEKDGDLKRADSVIENLRKSNLELQKNQMNEVMTLRQQISCLTTETEQQQTKIKSGELARQNLQIELEQTKIKLQSVEQKLNDEKLIVTKMMDDQNKALEKEMEHVHLNNRINSLEKALESGNLKTSQLCQNITDLTLQLEYARQELSSQKLKEKNLQDQLTKRGGEINELIRKNEKMVKDITEKHEKVQEKLAKDLSEKTDEIHALRRTLDSKRNDCSFGAKKAEKKLNDTLGQIEKLKNQVKELTLEKRESTKKLAIQEQQISELNNKLTATTEEYEAQKEIQQATLAALEKLKEEVKEFRIKDAGSEQEIARLSAIEKEYNEFKHQVLENSPPASTQLPAELRTIVTQTPKSPALSLRLKNMTIVKTPQKTPRSILKQPGSASKRRRVFFAAESKENQVTDVQSDCEKEDGGESEEPVLISPLPFTNTPNLHTAKIQSLEKTSNIRKTPGRRGPKFTDSNTITGGVKKLGDNWFDSDQLFGLGIED